VRAVTKWSVDSRDEVEASNDKVGDIHYGIYLKEPNAQQKLNQCETMGEIDVLLRKGKYFPESRTANWIMLGDCSTRFALPPH
jgi:hypothetical protein